VVALFNGALAASGVGAVTGHLAGPLGPAGVVLAVVLAGVAGVTAGVRGAVIALTLTSDAVVVRNPLRTYTVAWGDITGFSMASGEAHRMYVAIERAGGRAIRAVAAPLGQRVQGGWTRAARERMALIRSVAAAQGVRAQFDDEVDATELPPRGRRDAMSSRR
jgi:hypothetical protein